MDSKSKNILNEGIYDTKLEVVVDDKLFGTYLKLTGLTAISLTPSTLIPLGVLMSVYNITTICYS